MGGGGAPTLADVASLKSPNGVFLLESLSLSMAQSAHTCLQVFLKPFIVRDNPSDHGLAKFVQALMEQAMDLERYPPQDWCIKSHLLALLKRWVNIRLLDCISRQWERGGGGGGGGLGTIPGPVSHLEEVGPQGTMGDNFTP